MRSLVKVLVITLLVGFVGAQFLPDVIHVPKRWPRLPRVEFVREGAAVDSGPGLAPVAPVAAAPPETAAVQLPPVAAAPSLDAAKSARQAKRAKPKPKPKPQELPEEDGAWFSTEPTAMIIPVRISTQVELAGSSREIPTPPAPEVKTGDEWPVLCGEVVDSTGAAVDGADVRIEATDVTERTDHKGRFCLACPTRKLTLLVGVGGRESVRYAVELEGRNTQVRVTLR